MPLVEVFGEQYVERHSTPHEHTRDGAHQEVAPNDPKYRQGDGCSGEYHGNSQVPLELSGEDGNKAENNIRNSREQSDDRQSPPRSTLE